MARHTPPQAAPAQQSGVVLVIVLIFMLALTTIAIFTARNVTLGERKSRNELEYQVARQAAEAALRDAERDMRLERNPIVPATTTCKRDDSVLRTEDSVVSDAEFTSDCLKGQCQLPSAQYNTSWNVATAITGSAPGEAWWPESKGGAWGGDYFKTKMPNTTTAPDCAAFKGSVPLGLFTGAAPLSGVTRQPEYLIEYLANPMQETGAAAIKGFACPTALVNTTGGLASADAAATTTPQISQNMPCLLFRITARGYGPTENAQVLMQTYFHIIKP
jgi:type IV pilus assembly protein PilX